MKKHYIFLEEGEEIKEGDEMLVVDQNECPSWDFIDVKFWGDKLGKYSITRREVKQ